MKLISGIERLVQATAFVMFAAMLVMTLAQVLFRYVLKIPVPWTEEAARMLFILATMGGIALAWRKREHIIVDFLFVMLPPKAMRALSIIFAVAILAFLALWARGAFDMIARNWTVELVTIGWFRVAYYYIWELAMISLIAIYILLDLRDLIIYARVDLQGNEPAADL